MQAIEAEAPGAVKAVVEFSGTNIQPLKQQLMIQ
jgi:hypothetical protein